MEKGYYDTCLNGKKTFLMPSIDCILCTSWVRRICLISSEDMSILCGKQGRQLRSCHNSDPDTILMSCVEDKRMLISPNGEDRLKQGNGSIQD